MGNNTESKPNSMLIHKIINVFSISVRDHQRFICAEPVFVLQAQLH